MKRTLLILAVAILACAPFVTAQTGGTISLSGNTLESYSLTNAGGTTITAAGVAFTDLTPVLSQALVTNESVLGYLRSNHKYKLSAQVTANSGFGGQTDAGDNIALSDIGFGIRGLVTTGTNVVNPASHVVVTKFNYVSTGWPAATTGVTPFVAGTNGTLNDITGDTQILSGSRISKLGNIANPDNAIQLTFGFAVLPQYFSPNSFTATITLTIAAN